VSFGLKDQKSAGELQPSAVIDPEKEQAQEQYRYVVMPMRI
jgi:hypothetical protein